MVVCREALSRVTLLYLDCMRIDSFYVKILVCLVGEERTYVGLILNSVFAGLAWRGVNGGLIA